ncbi:MAG TPA: hypothetical protein VHP63_01880 [candidate division Zixibacteria bacterium]|nr:hypothetical protein [candidate division Zixibacteria bacterium]
MTSKMIVMKNKFISQKAPQTVKTLRKADALGEENQDAFCRETGKMRFSFSPIAGGSGGFPAKNG